MSAHMGSDAEVLRDGNELVASSLRQAQLSLPKWSGRSIKDRLRIIRRVRYLIARDCEALAGTLAHRRPAVETLVTEVLPLVEAARFLERNAERLLAPRILRHGRPLWLPGVRAEVRREPLGVVLILSPSNYPLFLPGVQILQALAAGNVVCAKPALGCAEPLQRFAALSSEAGLPTGVLTVLDESLGTAAAAARAGFNKILLSGSASTGRLVLQAAAPRLTPTTMELSGNDAVFVLDGADLDLVASCLAYGLRLNGGATCIAPRRVFVVGTSVQYLEQALLSRIGDIGPASVPQRIRTQLQSLLTEAAASGARVLGWPDADRVPPIVVADAREDLRLLREDVFAPVLAIVAVRDMEQALQAAAACPYALGAAIFGPPAEAHLLATKVNAGSVVVNDIIVPTADPRLPFGGRGESGFGVTRGAEGLLELTAVKTISTRRGRFRPHLTAPRPDEAPRYAALIKLLHGERSFRGLPWFKHLRQSWRALLR
jgi:acyl-CoA reductase-like NAD-dependent aldehyde dehydrogenase